MQEKPKAETYQITASGPQQMIDTASMFDWKTFFENLLKITSVNYAGNPQLSWGLIKL